MKPDIQTETELNLYFKTKRLDIAKDKKEIEKNLKSITYFRNKYRAELKFKRLYD